MKLYSVNCHTRSRLNEFVTIVFCVLLLPGLSSCIGVPIKAPPGEKPFNQEYMTHVEVGETNREQVRLHLEKAPGAPRLTRFDEDTTWVYYATRDTWQWLVCAGGPYVADCGVLGDVRDHFLIFEFDDNDVVQGWSTASTLGRCADNRVCNVGKLIMIYAGETRDHQAKNSESLSACDLYVYSTLRWSSPAYVIGVWLDGGLLGWFVEDDAFLFAAIEPGSHTLRTMQISSSLDDVADGRHNQYLVFDCAASDSVYLHHNSRHPDKDGRRFLLVEEDAAAQLVKRRLILQPVTEPQDWQTASAGPEYAVAQKDDDTVWRVQRELRMLGYFDGALDGELSTETASAIRSFKSDKELPGETLLDDNTLAALGFYERR